MRQPTDRSQVHVKKIVDDTERRLSILFDGLNNDTVPKVAADQMQNISKGKSAIAVEADVQPSPREMPMPLWRCTSSC
jgi:hypothetical protein